jgi:hypothetical protein
LLPAGRRAAALGAAVQVNVDMTLMMMMMDDDQQAPTKCPFFSIEAIA